MSAAVARRAAPCTVRIGKPDDLAFVVDSWTKHAHRGQRMRDATRHVRALLAREGAALVVAHVPDESDAILGWAVLETGLRPCVHYVYVRSAAREQGVASAMLAGWTSTALDYSSEPPASVRVPAMWTLNLKRSET